MQLSAKSGVVSAMWEHNLPIICISKYWNPSGTTNVYANPDIIEYKGNDLEKCLSKGFEVTPYRKQSFRCFIIIG